MLTGELPADARIQGVEQGEGSMRNVWRTRGDILAAVRPSSSMEHIGNAIL